MPAAVSSDCTDQTESLLAWEEMVPSAKDLSLQKAESLTLFLKPTGTQLIDTIHEDLN